MSLAGTLITIGAAALGYWVVRSVLEAPDAVPRSAPLPRTAARTASRAPPGNATRRRPSAPDPAWYILLDVPSGAGRGEIREALRRRIARARADGDTAAIAALLRAAAEGMRAPPRRGHARGVAGKPVVRGPRAG